MQNRVKLFPKKTRVYHTYMCMEGDEIRMSKHIVNAIANEKVITK